MSARCQKRTSAEELACVAPSALICINTDRHQPPYPRSWELHNIYTLRAAPVRWSENIGEVLVQHGPVIGVSMR